MNNKCPCGSGVNYTECCERYISNINLPTSPEELMRSRYTAYSMAKIDYIAITMCGKAFQGFDVEESRSWARSVIWEKLQVLNSNLVNEIKGFVEFKAYFRENNQQCILHEKSEFHKINGKWFYVDGMIFDS